MVSMALETRRNREDEERQFLSLVTAKRAQPHDGDRVDVCKKRPIRNRRQINLLLGWMQSHSASPQDGRELQARIARPPYRPQTAFAVSRVTRAACAHRFVTRVVPSTHAHGRSPRQPSRSCGPRRASSAIYRSSSTSSDDGGGSEPGPSSSTKPHGLSRPGRRANSRRVEVAR